MLISCMTTNSLVFFFYQAYDASAIFEAAQGRLQGGRFYLRTK